MATIINGDSVSFSDLTTQKSAANQVVGFKNKIIGGDFTTNPWQRGTSFPAIASGTYFADRWRAVNNTTAVLTASKAVDAPTVAQAGLFTQHCLSLAVTTADTVVDAGDAVCIDQVIEGLNAASFGFGQAGSRNVTMSFWVKGTQTGIHCVALRNSALSRSYVAEYTIVTTNTWEYKTITIPVETTGTWLYDTGVGILARFTLMAGTTYQTTANTWAVGDFIATANQVNAVGTLNTFKIALVQLEAGSVATPFDARSVGQELVLCQRYFELRTVGGAVSNERLATTGLTVSTTSAQYPIQHVVQKRASPAINVVNLASTSTFDSTGTGTPTGWNLDNTGVFITNITLSGMVSATSGRATHWTWSNITPLPFITISSEL